MSRFDEKYLISIEHKLKNLTELHRLIAGTMLSKVQRNFQDERAGTGGVKWLPLARATIRQRMAKGHWPGRILQRKGGRAGLLGSIHESSNRDEAAVGTNLIYAAIHQTGGTINQAARSNLFVHNRWGDNDKGMRDELFKKGKMKRGRGFSYSARKIVIPARPFLVLSNTDLLDIKLEILDFLTE